MKKTLLLTILLTVNFSNSQESWFPLGPDDFNQPSFGVINYSKISHDNNNIPYIAFSDVFNNDKITVRKYINNKWTTVGSLGFSDGIASFISIDFDSNNIPYVAYKDTDIKIKKFDGTSWISLGNPSASTNFEFSFKIAENNIPYIAFQNPSNNNKAAVKKFNGSTWEFVGIDGISANKSNYISLAINNQNVPYIAYSDVSTVNKASVQRFNGVTWEYVGNQAFTLGESTYNSIKFDKNNIPYLLYRDGATSGKATLQKFSNNNWSVVGISGFTSANALDLSFTFDSNNIPFVVYKTDNGYEYVSVYKFYNSTWSNVGNQYISDRQADYSSISIDNSNNLFIAYKDVENGNIGIVKKFINGSWIVIGDVSFTKETSNIYTVTDSNNVIYVLHEEFYEKTLTVKKYFHGEWLQVGDILGTVRNNACSLAIDNNNNLYVSYSSDSNGGVLRVKKFDGNSWVALSDNTLPNNTIYSTSIAVDSDNKPYVVYKENTLSLSMKKFDGISWANINSSTTLGDTSNPRLFIDKNIIPNILYLSYGNWNNKGSLVKFTNGAWSSISGVGGGIKLKNNILYSLFKSSNTTLEIKKFNGTNWEQVQNAITTIDINDNLVDLYLTTDSYLVLKRNIITDKLSLNKFDGTVWSTIGSNNFNSGKSSFAKLSLLNNLPVVVYSADKGCFAKYFGAPDALNTSNFITNNEFSTIYPNPIINTFKIKSDLSISEIFIYDLSSKKVFESKNIIGEINVDFLPKGLYLLKIITKDRFGTVKLIKE